MYTACRLMRIKPHMHTYGIISGEPRDPGPFSITKATANCHCPGRQDIAPIA